MSDKVTPLAAFDLDGTVLRGQSGPAWAWYLARQGLVAPAFAIEVAWLFVRYRRSKRLDYDQLAESMLLRFKGRPVVRFEALLDRFVADRLLPTVRHDARQRMAELRADGVHVVLASAALAPIVERVAAALPVDGWIATQLAPTIDGNFAGRLDGPVRHGLAKVAALTTYAEARFERWSLRHAFTDHESDLALLEAAQFPVTVNPSPGLTSIARTRDWPIARWR